MAFLKVGEQAPKFSLANQRGELVTLKKFKCYKCIVEYFYPKAIIPGCTVRGCGIRVTDADFNGLDPVVIGVSPDSVDRLV